jgi:hypothetical protein
LDYSLRTGADELVRLLAGRLAAGEVRGQLTLNGVNATAAQLRQVRPGMPMSTAADCN